jgi:hypothetical protein
VHGQRERQYRQTRHHAKRSVARLAHAPTDLRIRAGATCSSRYGTPARPHDPRRSRPLRPGYDLRIQRGAGKGVHRSLTFCSSAQDGPDSIEVSAGKLPQGTTVDGAVSRAAMTYGSNAAAAQPGAPGTPRPERPSRTAVTQQPMPRGTAAGGYGGSSPGRYREQPGGRQRGAQQVALPHPPGGQRTIRPTFPWACGARHRAGPGSD